MQAEGRTEKPGIALIGPMGAGKSTVGAALAERLALPFLDVDEVIAERFGPVATIFAERGEGGFRELERVVLRERVESAQGVVALGGGSVLHEDIRAVLGDDSVVFLDVSADAVGRRLVGQDLPLLRRGLEDWTVVYAARRHRYDSLADVRIDTSRRSVNEVVDDVLASLREFGEPDPNRVERASSAPPGVVPLTVHELASQWVQRDRDALQVELVGLLRRAALSTAASSDPLLAEHGLTRGQFDVLAALYRGEDDGAMSQATLAERMMVTPAGMKKRLGGLMDQDLVVRSQDPADARRYLLSLTAGGAGLLERLLDDFFAAEARSIARLDTAEQRRFVDLLQVMLGEDR